MSFVVDETDPNDPNKQPQSQTDVSLGGGGGVAGPAAGPAMGSSTAKPTTSGSWTNLQSYLDANKDQGEQVGSQIASTVGSQAQKAQDDVSNAAGDFTSQVNANTIESNPDQVNQSIGKASGLKAGESLSDDDLSGYQKQANASYSGPTDFTQHSGYGQAVSDINSAQGGLSRLGSEAGRDVLLQDQYKNASSHGYNQGEKNLDQLLLEGSKENQNKFSDLSNHWAGLSGILGDTTNAQNTLAKKGAETDTNTAKTAQDAMAAAIARQKSGLDTTTAQANAQRQQQFQGILDELNNNNLDSDSLNNFGLTAGERLYGLNLSDYLDPNAVGTLNKNQAATPDQVAQFKALAQLSGQPELGGYITPEAQSSPISFATSKFNLDSSLAQNSFNTEYQKALSSMIGGGPYDTGQTSGGKPIMGTSPGSPLSGYINGGVNAGFLPQVQQALVPVNALRAKYGLGGISFAKGSDGRYYAKYGPDTMINGGQASGVPSASVGAPDTGFSPTSTEPPFTNVLTPPSDVGTVTAPSAPQPDYSSPTNNDAERLPDMAALPAGYGVRRRF